MTNSEKDVLMSDVVETKNVSNVTEKRNKTNNTEKVSVIEKKNSILKTVFDKKTNVSKQVEYYLELTKNSTKRLENYRKYEQLEYDRIKNINKDELENFKTKFEKETTNDENEIKDLKITKTDVLKQIDVNLKNVRNEILKNMTELIKLKDIRNEYIHKNEQYVYEIVEKKLTEKTDKKDDKKETTKNKKTDIKETLTTRKKK